MSAAALVLSCSDPQRVDQIGLAAPLMDLPVPWDTLRLHEVLVDPEWQQIKLTPYEHCWTFSRPPGHWTNRYCGLTHYFNCPTEYYPDIIRSISPSLFFNRRIDIPYLHCLVAFEYPRYAKGQLFSMSSYFSLTPPRISVKLFHNDSLIQRLAKDTASPPPFDKDGFRQLYHQLDLYLRDLTGDPTPHQRFPELQDPYCFAPRNYSDLLGQLEYNFGKYGCIEASLKCLPAQPVLTYRREAVKSEALVWDPDKDEYWEDTTVQNEQQFQAKYHRHSTTSDEIVYDVHWEDLAIYVEILFNRYEGQSMGVGDTVGMAPCPRITSTRLPVRQ